MSELTIKPLDQMPKTKAKAKKKTDLRKLIDKFDADKMKIAEIPVQGTTTVKDKKTGKMVTKPKTAKGIRIGIGRILSKDKRTDIETYESADGKSVILKKK